MSIHKANGTASATTSSEWEARYRNLLASVQEGILIVDADTGVVVEVNPFLAKLLGFPPGSMLGKRMWELGFLSSLAADRAAFDELKAKACDRCEELLLETADGRRLDVELAGRFHVTGGHRILQCNIRDNTERKAARWVAQRLSAIEDHSKDAIIAKTLDGIVTSWNRGAERLFGYTGVEMIGQAITRLIPPELQAEELRILASIRKGETVEPFDTVRVRKDGHRVDISVTVTPIRDGNGCVVGASKIARDISESRFRHLVEQSIAGIYMIQDDRFIYVNPTMSDILGYSAAELMSRPVLEFIARADRPLAADNIRRRISGEIESLRYQLHMLRKDGTEICVEVHGGRAEINDRPAIIGILVDVSDTKRAEAALRESEGRLQAIMENSPALIFIKDLQGRYLLVNRRFEEEFALSRDAILGRTDLEIFPAGQAKLFRSNDAEVLKHNRPLLFEEVARYRNGEHASLVSKFPLLDATGKAHALCGIAIGITERKRAEEALRKTNATLQSIFDAAPVAVISFDLEGRITYWSRGAERMFGWTEAEAFGRVCPTVPPDGMADFLEMIKRVAAHGPESLTRVRQRKNGEALHTRLHPAPLCNPAGQVQEITVIMEDVTDTHLAEEAVRLSEERLKLLIESSIDAIITVDEHLRIELFNKGAETIFGYRAAEVLGRTLDLLWPEQSVEAHRRYVREFGAAAGTSRIMAPGRDVFGRRKDGSVFPAEASIAKQITRGQLLFTVFLRDITDRKQAELRLQAAENLMSRALASLSEAVLVVDPSTRTVLQCNPAVERLFGYKPEELAGQNTEMLHVSRRSYEEFGALSELALDRHGIFRAEFHMRRKDGTIFATENTVTPIRESEGWRKGVVSVVRDISDREQAEAALRAGQKQLQELTHRLVNAQESSRRELSRELHDRVGQNLGTLNLNLTVLQSAIPPDQAGGAHARINDSLRILAETMGQVRDVMSELRPPVLDDYGLAAALRWYTEKEALRAGLQVRMHVDAAFPRLSPEAEIALFRIAQQALANTISHAHARETVIGLLVTGRGLQMKIADDGVGFDPAVPRKAPGWGLTTMRERAVAIGGEFQLVSAAGEGTTVSVTIRFDAGAETSCSI